MTPTWKPRGYPSVSPYLVVERAKETIAFLEKVFDATPLRRYDAPDGSIMHAELRIDDSVVMIGHAGPSWPAVPMHIHIYVADVDAAYRRALEAGGVSVQEPKANAGDPDRRGGVKDPGGNTWWMGTQVS